MQGATVNNLTDNCITIDTNIFVGLLNPEKNTNDHIAELLYALQDDCIFLITDMDGKIWGEYETAIPNAMTNGRKNSEYNPLLKFWLNPNRYRKIVPIDTNVINGIKNIIGKNNTIDATFVCVAMVSDKTLITNDRADMIDRGTQTDYTRNKLLKLAKDSPYKRRSFRIWDSKEAHGKL